MNLYGFVRNSGVNYVDRLGLDLFPPLLTKDDLWDSLLDNDPESWGYMPPLRRTNIKHKPINFDDYCPCVEEIITDGHLKLIDIWVEWAVMYDRAVGVKIGCAGVGDHDSCIAVNTDLNDYIKSRIPPCWTCELEEGWRDKTSSDDPPWYETATEIIGGYRYRRNHWWVTCQARNTEGQVVKEIAFDYWRSTSDVWGGMDPSINRYKYPYDEPVVEW